MHTPRTPAEPPADRVDVLAYRGPTDGADGVGWDLCYVLDGAWHSATYAGEPIPAPVAWWHLPEAPAAEGVAA